MPKRIIFPEKGVATLASFELPAVGPSDIRVRTHFSLMSIGTETIILHQRYDPDTHFAKIFSFPQLKTGVQAIGQVETVGADVVEFKRGDWVFMRMAHGSHQVLPADTCSPVPDGVDLKSACWCGLAKTAFRAAWAGQFGAGLHILVIGAGPVGQMAVRWASATDVETIAVVDIASKRLHHARAGGANMILEGDVAEQLADIQSINSGQGPNIVIDTTGNPAVFQHALAAAPQYSKVILLGDTGYPGQQRLTSDVMSKGLTIQAVHDSHDRDGWTQRKIDERFFAEVQARRLKLDGLISHEFAPEDCAEAYALADRQRSSVMGLLYDWRKTD